MIPAINTSTRDGRVVAHYKNHAICLNGPSYSCPALKLFGYATETQVERAINRVLKKTVANVAVKGDES